MIENFISTIKTNNYKSIMQHFDVLSNNLRRAIRRQTMDLGLIECKEASRID